MNVAAISPLVATIAMLVVVLSGLVDLITRVAPATVPRAIAIQADRGSGFGPIHSTHIPQQQRLTSSPP